jgi:hypothetical protein
MSDGRGCIKLLEREDARPGDVAVCEDWRDTWSRNLHARRRVMDRRTIVVAIAWVGLGLCR